MPKKSIAKKKTTRQPRAAQNVIERMNGGVVADKVIAKRGNIIMGNQYNDNRKIEITTPAQFLAEAETVRAQIAKIKQQPELLPAQVRRLEAVEGDVNEAIAEAHTPQPLGERIKTTLEGAAETMETLKKSLSGAMELGETIGKVVLLADAASKIFVPH